MSVSSDRQGAVFDLPTGTTLGKYEVLRKIATGGMAEIYLARVRGTAGFEKLVVLKRILPNVAEDPTFVQMFLDEARLAATLQHPNIADVYDVGDDSGAPFFAMEFIHGQDVRSIRMAARKSNEQVPLAIVGQLFALIRVDGERTRSCKQEHVVVIGADEGLDGDNAVTAGSVLDDDRVVPLALQALGEHACADVGTSAGTERNDKTDVAVRPSLALRRSR